MPEITREVRSPARRGRGVPRSPCPRRRAPARTSTSTSPRHPTFGVGLAAGRREQMAAVFADRGGDPDRAGKRDPLDPLLWRAARDGEPSWDDELLGAGPARAGTSSAPPSRCDHLGLPFDVQGGGTDLVFPHHEMSAAQSRGAHRRRPFARHYVHQAMVGYDGREDEQVPRQPGARVEAARRRRRPDGDPARAARQHYRTDWDYTDDLLERGAGPAGPVARGAVGQRRARRGRRRSPPSAPRSPTTSTPRGPGRGRRLGRALPAPASGDRTTARAGASLAREPRGRRPRRRAVWPDGALSVSPSVPAPAQVALELLGDRVAARLGQVGGVLGLLEALDVLGDLGVGGRELVDAALPRVRVLVELAVRDRAVEQVLEPADQRERGLGRRGCGRRSAARRPSRRPTARRPGSRRPRAPRRCRSGPS